MVGAAAAAGRAARCRDGPPALRGAVDAEGALSAGALDLSDPGLEEALLDRLSFRRFCGFALDDATPDETTICRFRAAAADAGTLQACFGEVNRQLEAKGLEGHADGRDHRPGCAQPAVAGGRHGIGSSARARPDWTNKNGKSAFGYKLHIGMDEGSGIVRRAVFTPARRSESEDADDLVSGDETAVYGDNGGRD